MIKAGDIIECFDLLVSEYRWYCIEHNERMNRLESELGIYLVIDDHYGKYDDVIMIMPSGNIIRENPTWIQDNEFKRFRIHRN